MCFKGITNCLKAHNSKRWDAITCKIVQSKIVEEKDSDGDLMFEAMVKYQYVYNGNQYIGDKIYFGYASSSEKEGSTRLATSLPEGKEVVAYINPKNPQDAILIPGIPTVYFDSCLGRIRFCFYGFLVFSYLVSIYRRTPRDFK